MIYYKLYKRFMNSTIFARFMISYCEGEKR